MKSINATVPYFYAAETDTQPNVPKGKMHIHTVKFETYELDAEENAMKDVQFSVLSPNSIEFKRLAKFLKGNK